jgi:hypothetical protein
MIKLLILFILSPIFILGQTQIGNDIYGVSPRDQFGKSVSISSNGNIIAVGAPYDDNINGINCGLVKIYNNESGDWIQIGNDILGEEQYDISGASISLNSDGNIIAIGAPFNHGNNGNDFDSGHVRIFKNINNIWTQIGNDIEGEYALNLGGSAVSLSSDGNIVAIGSPRNHDNGFQSGHVRIFKNVQGLWTQIGQDITGEAEDDQCGSALSISSNGNILAIGAYRNGNSSGHVRIYENILDVWTQIGDDIDGEFEHDWFGQSVSLNYNGNIVAIGAIFNDDNGNSSGHVRVFYNSEGEWVQVGQNIEGEVSGDRFGGSISMNNDGTILAIGSTVNSNDSFQSGHVRIFKNFNGVWGQIGNDINGDIEFGNFGSDIELNNNGNYIIIGGSGNNNENVITSRVKVYDLSVILSVEEQSILDFNFYPNPTKNQFTIQLDYSDILENVNIYNNLGQLVLTSQKVIVNTTTLSAGLYVVELETNKGKGSKKLIIE